MNKLLATALVLAGIGIFTLPTAAQENALPAAVLKALMKAEKFELLSLRPDSEKGQPKGDFHNYTVLGGTVVKDAAVRKNIIDALTKGMKGDIVPAKCFEPRHGIRAALDGKKIDLVICFECSQFYVHDGAGKSTRYLVNESPQPLLNQVLKDAGVKLAK